MSTKKTYTEAELQKAAEGALKSYPHADRVFATTDGNVFLDRNRAELHAGKGRVVQINRPLPQPEAPEEPAINAKEAIKQIGTATLEELAAFADDTRKTVREAYQKRLVELGIDPQEAKEE